MTTINETFTNAVLADAAYVGNLSLANTPDKLMTALSTRMTPTLADQISKNFSVVTQIESAGSSFDATVWQANNADGKPNLHGKLYVSIRGTQQLTDFLIDANLAVTGSAQAQLVDMVNWWLKISTPVGQTATQIRTKIAGGLAGQFYELASSVPGTGLIKTADLVNGIEVNGHSLGGYLATAFTRLFGAQAHVTHTSTFNSAGFAVGSEAVFTELQNLIGLSYGLGRFHNASEQTNYFAQNGLTLSTKNSWFTQTGVRVEQFNESDETQRGNHFICKMNSQNIGGGLWLGC